MSDLQRLRDELAEAVRRESSISDGISKLRQISWEIRAHRFVITWLVMTLPLRYMINWAERIKARQHEIVLRLQARADVELRPGYPWTAISMMTLRTSPTE